MNIVKVYVSGIFLCTIPEDRVKGMMGYLHSKGFYTVTIRKD